MGKSALLIILLLFSIKLHVFCDEVVDAQDEPDVTPEDISDSPVDDGLTDIPENFMEEIRDKTTPNSFQAEVNQMMQIIINSLYKNKEIFLRELISNANDALDKIRYLSVKNSSVLDSNKDLSIKIKVDNMAKVLVIQDSGIGMTKEELENNLGTIAKSGTKEFVKKVQALSDDGTDKKVGVDTSSLIGQFGVGFYSSFLIAERVVVISKSNDDNKQYIWESDSTSFRLAEDPRGDTLGRGTSIILHLREEAKEFLENDKIISLVKRYSEFIDFPIYVWSKEDENKSKVDGHWQHINTVKPIWMRSPSDINETEYRDFFNFVYYGKEKDKYSDPSLTVHFTAEGEITFRALVFIPNKMPIEYINSPLSYKYPLKLYSRKVFITDETKSILPYFLGYIGGVIDSDDLPLNVGRETLQQHQLMKVIKKKLTRKILDSVKKLKIKEGFNYSSFFEEFGTSFKYGVMDDSLNANRLADLLLFKSSKSNGAYTTLEEYVNRMKPGQPALYYITAQTLNEAERSPYVETLKRKDYEVLYMTDNIDESSMSALKHYSNKPLQHVGKVGHEAEKSKSEEERLKQKEEEFKPLVDWLKEGLLRTKVASIKVSPRLVTSSCILVGTEYSYSGNMDRLLRSQSYVKGKESAYEALLSQPKNLEINPYHPLCKKMLEEFNNDRNSENTKTIVDACFTSATLASGYSIEDPLKVSSFIEGLVLQKYDIDPSKIANEIDKELGFDEDDDTPNGDEIVNPEEIPSPDSKPESVEDVDGRESEL